jgi:hypothetical protein
VNEGASSSGLSTTYSCPGWSPKQNSARPFVPARCLALSMVVCPTRCFGQLSAAGLWVSDLFQGGRCARHELSVSGARRWCTGWGAGPLGPRAAGWRGRVRGPDGHHVWVKACDLRPAKGWRIAALEAGLQPRQDDQVNEGVDKQADRERIRTDPDGPLSEALTGCNQE